MISSQPRVANSAFTENNGKFLPQPRIGIAWSPFSSKTVVRAEIQGMYNDLQDSLRIQDGPEIGPSIPPIRLHLCRCRSSPSTPLRFRRTQSWCLEGHSRIYTDPDVDLVVAESAAGNHSQYLIYPLGT